MPTPALTPSSGGGLCIGVDALKPADILVSGADSAVADIVKIGTFSHVSHAFLYTGGGNVIEAVGSGVREVQLGVSLGIGKKDGDTLAVAYRDLKVTPDVASKIIKFARDQAQGKKAYDTRGTIGAGLHSNTLLCVAVLGVYGCAAARDVKWKTDGKFFCSELVLAAFNAGGLSLVNGDPANYAPQDIVNLYSNGILSYVGHLESLRK